MNLSVNERCTAVDWEQVFLDLDTKGAAIVKGLLSPDECMTISALYSNDDGFRSRVVMERHGFGRGEYKYFSYPLPDLIMNLRTTTYVSLVPIANRWNALMNIEIRYSVSHVEFLHRCHLAGQQKPTPLLLKYVTDDYNCLHQALYGEHIFPLQIAILLNEPIRDFVGGEFVITEQRPRMQSRPSVIPLHQRDAVPPG